MTMTKADFENVAQMFASKYADNARKDYLSETTREFCASTIDSCAYGMARVAILSNRRFNVRRFLAACGMRADMVEQYAEMVERDAKSFFGLPDDYVTR